MNGSHFRIAEGIWHGTFDIYIIGIMGETLWNIFKMLLCLVSEQFSDVDTISFSILTTGTFWLRTFKVTYLGIVRATIKTVLFDCSHGISTI